MWWIATVCQQIWGPVPAHTHKHQAEIFWDLAHDNKLGAFTDEDPNAVCEDATQ